MGAPSPWARFTMPHAYAPSSTGAPVPAARLYFFASGTSTPLATFADATLSQPNPNPVIANQDGVFPDIFLQNLAYKVVLRAAAPPDGTGEVLDFADPVAPFIPAAPPAPGGIAVMEMVRDGNGAVLVGGQGDCICPIDCTIIAAYLQADLPGDAVVEVWVAPFVTNTPPNGLNAITASDPMKLSASVGSVDTTLTGWKVGVAAGSWVRFNIDSIDTITRLTATLVATPGLPA